jgi:DTW domain-containing protein YfiP
MYIKQSSLLLYLPINYLMTFSITTLLNETMSKHSLRPYCAKCKYPQATCVCSEIDIISVAVNVVILQHVKEREHAKNTARLVSLCIPTANIISSDDDEAVNALHEHCNKTNSAVIYPSDDSIAIENDFVTPLKGIDTILFIDGSWKQAFGMMQKYHWLQALPAYHFSQAPNTNYSIRHTRIDKGLSTLEAVAYTLSCAFNTDVAPLHKAQQAMQQHWQGPQSHRRGTQ